MPVILLNIPYIQQKVADATTSELSNRLNVPVKVGEVSITWFNRLVLDDLYLEDEDGGVLFEAKHVTAGFKPFPLLKGKFVFTTVRLFGFSVNLKKDTPESKLNLQFVIDAFASRDTTKQSPNVDLQFNSVLIRKGNFTYNVLSEDTTPGKFNAKHVDIRDISAKISLKAFNQDSVNAAIKKMSFRETSGFDLNKLSINIVGNRDSVFIQDFEIRLPKSEFRVEKANINLKEVHEPEDFLTKAPIVLKIPTSQIYLHELSPFVPVFHNFHDPVELSAEASGYIDDIQLDRLSLIYSDKMQFLGEMSLRGASKPEETYLFGKVSKMHITNEGLSSLINNFSKEPIILPTPVTRLGRIDFTGEISGFFDNLVAFGKLSTAIGSIETDVLFGSKKEKNIAAYISGRIASSELLINELLEVDNPFGIARLDIALEAQRPVNGSLAGNIKAHISEFDYRNYRYENIQLEGNFKRNGFDGMIHIDDPNGFLSAEGMFEHKGQNSIFNFAARLDHFRPDNLNLTDKFESPEISVSLNADFTGDNIDNVQGFISVDSLSIQTAPSDFFLKQLKVTATGNYPDKKLLITSDIINGEVNGVYSFNTLVPGFLNTLKGYVPALINATTDDLYAMENNFSLMLTFENTEALSKTLKLPFTIIDPGRITGHFNNQFNKFRLEAFFPQFKIGQSAFESFYLECENPLDKIDLELRATNYNVRGLRNYLDIKTELQDNKVTNLLTWSNNKERKFEARLGSSIFFAEEEDDENKGNPKLRTEVNINESSLVLNDSIWHVEEAGITVLDGRVDISNFYISHENQYLKLDGTVSKDPSDVLMLDLNDIEIGYVFDLLNNPILQFAGRATGLFSLSDLYGNRVLVTENFEVENFSFNQTNLGKLNLHSYWEDSDQSIQMLGTIYSTDSTFTDVNGYIIPVGPKAGLSLLFDARDLNVAFLHPFLENVASNVQGKAFGQIRLFGPFSALDLEGHGYVKDGGIGIDFLNTYYSFSDSVLLEPGLIALNNATVYDKYGNTGKVSFALKHKHFKELDYNAGIQTNNLLVYDASERHNPLIYGTVFGSGTSRIRGNEQLINFDINMRSEPKTSVSLNFMSNSSAAEYDFITFIDKDKITENSSDTITSPRIPTMMTNEGVELRMNFLLDITADANIELIMDPSAGDKIKGNGTGSLQVEYGTKSDMKMYGIFNILSGNYNFSLQQLIYKDFKIRDGSTVTFQGDPYNATLNIDAVYNVTANIGDLDPGLIGESARTNIPVNCVLMIDGILQNPSISFDLELPGSNEDLERKVKSYVNTEDMMTRQIVYLLVLNKFYTEDMMRTDRTSSEFSAVTSAAISSQISSILNNITDKVQIGTNIRASQEGFNETEFEMLLSSQLLNNRLIFNGNFGYKNNPNVKNVFVGEFDIEYLLTRTGEIRLKAYNHANDMYRYLKQSLTTQGIGIMYKKDFSTFSELLRRRRRALQIIPADTTPVLPQDSTMITP